VEIVETEVEECEEMERVFRGKLLEASMERLRPRSESLRASCSSATPFLSHWLAKDGKVWAVQKSKAYFRSRSLGTSLVSFGASLGFISCCVLEGRAA